MIRDNRIVFGAGWIDSIEAARPQDQIPVPELHEHGLQAPDAKQFTYRCANCTAEFDVPARGRARRAGIHGELLPHGPAGRPALPGQALDAAYTSRSQQHAIRRLDIAPLRAVRDDHLVTGEPWWRHTYARGGANPGGHGVGLSKTRVGQQRFREAMLARYGEACAFTGPQPPGALEAAHLYLYSQIPKHDPRADCSSDATCTHCSTGG